LRTGGADGVIGWADLVGAMAKLPNARFGEFYGNDPGSDFPFVRRH